MHATTRFTAFLVLLAPLLAVTADVDPSIVTHEQGIVDLTDDTFYDYLKSHKNVMVLFRDRTCDECPQIQEDLRVAIRKFAPKEQAWSIGRLNVHKYHQFFKFLQIQRFPKIRFYFDNEFHTTLNETPNQIAIEDFVQQLAAGVPAPKELATKADLDELNSKKVSLVLSLPNLSDEGRTFALNLQKVFPKIPVFLTIAESKFDRAIFGKDRPPYKFLLKRNFDDGNREQVSYTLFQPEAILNLVDKFRHERVRRLDRETMDQILSHHNPFLIVFDKDIHSDNVKTFRDFIFQQHYSGMIFRSDLKEKDVGQELGQLLGVEEKDFPVLMVVKNHHRRFQKYRYQGEFTLPALKDFLARYIKGEVPEYFRDRKSVKQTPRKPKELVPSTFQTHLQESKKHVLVLFYKARCHKCDELRQALHHVVNQLAEDNQIEVVQSDAGSNDYDWVNSRNLPQLFLYPIDRRDKPVEYTGKADDGDIVRFLGDELQKYIHRKNPAEVAHEWDL